MARLPAVVMPYSVTTALSRSLTHSVSSVMGTSVGNGVATGRLLESGAGMMDGVVEVAGAALMASTSGDALGAAAEVVDSGCIWSGASAVAVARVSGRGVEVVGEPLQADRVSTITEADERIRVLTIGERTLAHSWRFRGGDVESSKKRRAPTYTTCRSSSDTVPSTIRKDFATGFSLSMRDTII